MFEIIQILRASGRPVTAEQLSDRLVPTIIDA
jgi:predicted DNA-binding transcriptional regulator YafY